MARWLTAPLLALLALLALGVLGLQLVIVPLAAAEFGREFPELESLIVPFGVAAVAAGVFVQLGLLCIARLAVLARGDRIFDPRAFAWVRGLMVCIAGATLVVAAVSATLSFGVGGNPPLLAFAMIGVMLVGVTLLLLLLVLTRLLRQASAARAELAEVV
ncbi:DUF2975 domain-containing protein [Microcella daejeonensis]|uniref:DUF2975 domain-containing protein n=1 Tax=Microcella daejeonensis TaxID=2994971 RepID=A0A9E8S9D3_9MICO|nr:DUF2975 domain-containing protein [Microcella daejeonensis]WAB82238.1 DUF2975 domain-containing protein [Microcella daejeonensis]